mgnify:CR=1 FL=1
MKNNVLRKLLILCMGGGIAITSSALAATVKVVTDGNGKVSTDGTVWAESVQLTVADGDALGNDRVKYQPNQKYKYDHVTTDMTPLADKIDGKTSFMVMLDKSGNVYGIGSSKSGEFGSNLFTNKFIQILIQDEQGQDVKFKDIAAGLKFTVLLDKAGNVWTAGDNGKGQLGRDGDNKVFQKVDTKGVTFDAVAAGSEFAILLDTDGHLWGMGDNRNSQLGSNTTEKITECTRLLGSNKNLTFTAIAAGNDFSILLEKGTGYVWGMGGNKEGQLGTSKSNSFITPIRKLNFGGQDVCFTAIAAGSLHTVLLDNDGNVWTAGFNGANNRGGQLAREGSGESFQKVSLPAGLGRVSDVYAGTYQTFVQNQDGNIWAAGQNNDGRLGTGNISYKVPSLKPVTINGAGKIKYVLTCSTSYVIDKNGKMFSAGAKSDVLGRETNSANNPTFEPIDSSIETTTWGDMITRKINGDTMFTVHAVKQTLIHIRYDLDEGQWTQGSKEENYYEKETPKYVHPVDGPTYVKKQGYTFDGWEEPTTSGDDIEYWIKYKAKWKQNVYTIHYDMTEGGEPSTIPDKTDAAWDTVIRKDLPEITRPGYTLSGDMWRYTSTSNRGYFVSRKTTCESLLTTAGDEAVREITIKPVWAEKTGYTVRFDTDGGTTIGDKKNLKWTAAVLDAVSDPVKNGWIFDGWTYNGNPVSASATYADLAGTDDDPSHILVVKAKWRDATSPVITGVEDGKTYCSAQTMTVTDNDLESVTVNGAPVQLDAQNQYVLKPGNGPQRIVARDRAGNTTEVTVTINDGHTGGSATCVAKARCQVCGVEYGEVNPRNHAALRHVPAQDSTLSKEGNIEYWYCAACGKYFRDAAGTSEMSREQTIVPKLAPKTGDESRLALWFALLLISGGTIAIAIRKKKNR